MDILSNLWLGMTVAMSFTNLAYCLLGVFLGTAIGVLPGLGPVATIAMLLPVDLRPAAGIRADHAGGHLLRRPVRRLDHRDPGQPAGRILFGVTALDGYQMARQGQAGRALATAAIGSFFAGTVSTLLIALFAPPLAEVALKFGPAEYFSLMVLGLVASIVLAQRLAAARARHDRARPAARHGRHRRQLRDARVTPSTCPNSPTASAS